MDKDNSQFLNVFGNEFVEVVTNLNIVTSINVGEDGVQPVEMPLTVSGFVMDVDDMFVYLSKDGVEVDQGIPLDSIKHIAIVTFNKGTEDILDESDFPNDDGSYH